MKVPLVFALCTFQLLLPSLRAEQPYSLIHSLTEAPPPSAAGGQLGFAVATNGYHVVAGIPRSDIGATDAGVVKIYFPAGGVDGAIANPSPNPGDEFGSALAISPAASLMVVGAQRDDTGATNAGSAYVFLAEFPFVTHLVALHNPTPATDDLFGSAVAMDGQRAVIGAPQDDTGAADAGSVYLFDINYNGTATLFATLNNPTPAAADQFGSSVAISGTRVLVGAYADDTGAPNAGSAYLFDVSGATPVLVATINNPSPAGGDQFGFAVAISGTRVVIGAHRKDVSNVTDAGIAYVYDVSGATPTLVATLNNPAPHLDDRYGNPVAISGGKVVIGALLDDQGAADAGRAYVYDLNGATPTVPIALLNNPTPEAGDHLGEAVAIANDRVVVGAPFDDTGGTNAGSVYAFNLASATPETPELTVNNYGHSNRFGSSTAISGTRFVVGAPGEDAGALGGGRAYVYDLASATPLVPIFTLENPSPKQDAAFGEAVAMHGTRVVVGAPGDDSGTSNPDVVYVFDLSSATPQVPIATLPNPTPGGFERYGETVAIHGTRVVVGAPLDNTGASGAGIAYVFDLASASPSVPVVTLNNPSPSQSEYFGSAVAIFEARVVIGAWQESTGAAGTGSAYVYDLAGPSPQTPAVTINNPAPQNQDQFGWAVAIHRTRVVVGAPSDASGTVSGGRAFVFDVANSTPAIPIATIENPAAAQLDRFGSAVAISGTRVLVAAEWDNGLVGAAYLYDMAAGPLTAPVATFTNPTPQQDDFFSSGVAIDGATIVLGAEGDRSPHYAKGSAYIFGFAGPEIAVENSSGTELSDGASVVDFGITQAGGAAVMKAFTIRNLGFAPLTNLSLGVSGANSSQFSTSASGMATSLPHQGSTSFTATFAAPGPTSGVRAAQLHINSNDADENAFDVALSGTALSLTSDTDGDGLNDWAEHLYAPLGFQWQQSQPALVNTLMSNANAAGLYTPSQVQALYVGQPVIQRNAQTGQFTLTLGLEKSSDLASYTAFPFVSGKTTINPQGEIEFRFTVPDSAAFFILRAR